MATVQMDISELDALRSKITNLTNENESLKTKLINSEKVVKIVSQKIEGSIYYPAVKYGSDIMQVQSMREPLFPSRQKEYRFDEISFSDLVKRGLIQINTRVIPSESIETYENLDQVTERLKENLESIYSEKISNLEKENKSLLKELEIVKAESSEKIEDFCNKYRESKEKDFLEAKENIAEINQVNCDLKNKIKSLNNEIQLLNDQLYQFKKKEKRKFKSRLKRFFSNE